MDSTIEKLFNDAAFMEELKKKVTAEEVSDLFNKYGVNVTADKVEKVVEKLENPVNGEISEEQLEFVTGGGILAYGACLVAGFIVGRAVVKYFG